MKGRFGFSLIELLVVISILGILAAVAAPAYKSYAIHAKLASAVNFANVIVDKQKMYYNQHDAFPTTVAQIGLPTGASPEVTPLSSIGPDELAPYVPALSLASSAYTCPNTGVGLFLANYDGGGQTFVLGGSGGEYGSISVILADINNSLVSFCFFYAYTDALTDPKIIDGDIGNCVNALTYDPNDPSAYLNDILVPKLNSCN